MLEDVDNWEATLAQEERERGRRVVRTVEGRQHHAVDGEEGADVWGDELHREGNIDNAAFVCAALAFCGHMRPLGCRPISRSSHTSTCSPLD